MSSVGQFGRRRGSSKKVSSAEEASGMIQLPDLRQVTVFTKDEWLRMQDGLDQADEDKESIRQAAKQRAALHLQSKEASELAGQRQKRLEAKKIREEIEEEKRKVMDKEEANYREQQRKDAIEKAKIQLFHQTDRVKGLHRGLLLTEVLKEREAQIELKQRLKNASKDVNKDYLDLVKTREDEALQREQEKALGKKLKCRAIAEELKVKVKENELARERQKVENKEEAEEIQRLKELHQWEQRMEEDRQAKLKRDLMRAHLELVATRDLVRATDEQKLKAEEEQRKLFLSAKQKMTELRIDKEKALFREAQMRIERITDKLWVEQQDETDREEQRMAKAVAERDAKQARQQREEEEKKAAMLESIIVHREFMKKEKEQREHRTQQDHRDDLEGKKEADRIFSEKQQLKAQKIQEEARKLKDFHATQMAIRSARHQQLRREEQEFDMKNAELIAEEEKRFQQYSQEIISAAVEAQRNVFPLLKTAGEGVGGGHGPVTSGVRPRYLVQDCTGAQMPKYVSGTTQNIKKLHEAVDIQKAKGKLGFTWS